MSGDGVEPIKMKDEALSERFDRIPCLIVDNPICPRRPVSFRIRYQTSKDEGREWGHVFFSERAPSASYSGIDAPCQTRSRSIFWNHVYTGRVAQTADENERRGKKKGYLLHRETDFSIFFPFSFHFYFRFFFFFLIGVKGKSTTDGRPFLPWT